MDVASFIEELPRAGAVLVHSGERLRCEGPEALITGELEQRLREHKRDILAALGRERQAIIDAVVEPTPDGSIFDDGQFTEQLMVCQRAKQSGILTEADAHRLRDFLLRSWKPSGEPKGTRQTPMHAEEEQLPSPGDCPSCPAAVP